MEYIQKNSYHIDFRRFSAKYLFVVFLDKNGISWLSQQKLNSFLIIDYIQY